MIHYNPQKRQLFRSLANIEETFVRPPWAVSEYKFVSKCTSCNKCLDVCNESIIVLDSRLQPVIDFEKGECTFCGDCADVCESGAIDPLLNSLPWSHKVGFSDKCLSDNNSYCRSCGEVCGQEAIFFKLESGAIARPQLDLNLCNGCGACVSICPTKAIEIFVTSEEVA